MERKTEQRKRDEKAMAFAGFMGHTFFEVADSDGETMNNVRGEFSSIEAAMRLRDKGTRLYQKIGKGKYRLVG